MFKIYHIKRFKKIGITSRDVWVRIKEQFRVKKYGTIQFEILEVYDDEETAARREIELQKKYGYRVDLCKYNKKRLSDNGKRMAIINFKINDIKKVQKPKGINTPPKPIIVIDKIENKTYKFDSIGTAARALNISHGYITNVLAGRIKKTKKYDFKYAFDF